MAHKEKEQGMLLFFIQGESVITRRGWHYYAAHPNKYVRAAIASRLDCPQEIFELLAHDQEPAVIANVLYNPSCPALLAEAISLWMVHSNKYECMVWYFAVMRKSTPPFIVEMLIEKERQRRLEICMKVGTKPSSELTSKEFWKHLLPKN